jgi:Asp-tRNA(Asn)/Glu-tRNA(Gln) amidotransferase A subunit family amidase
LTSRTGIVPLSLTQDTSGPLARGVVDLALLLDVMAAYDPTDPVTKSAQRTAYRTGLTGASLKGVRIGLLLPLFGTAPDDAEVAGIVRKALDSTRANGTEIIELALPELDTLLQGTSVINAEFKHDLDAFLAQYPKAPVRTLAEIVASGKYNTAVDGVLKRANAVAERDTDAYRQALAKRDAARQAIIDVLKSQKLDGLAYPTLRRKPALIGQGQGGSNCQLSATTGLPAMGIPAGFTADGLPIGFDLLGDAFSESKLLRIAYAYEQAVKPRRPPPTTP